MTYIYRYNGLDQLDSVSHVIRFQFLKEHRNSIRIDDEEEPASSSTEDLSIIATLMCEYMAAASQFVQFGYDYYKYVCGTDEQSSTTDEKSCLIPVCSFRPNNPIKSSQKRAYNCEEDRNTLNFSDDSQLIQQSMDKRPKLNSSSSSSLHDEEEYDEFGRSRGLDSYCVTGVDDALQILSKAADCLRHIVELWQWASIKLSKKNLIDHLGGWEQGISSTNT